MIVPAFGLLLATICLSLWLRGSGRIDPNGEADASMLYAMQDTFVKIKSTVSESGGMSQDLSGVHPPRTIANIRNICLAYEQHLGHPVSDTANIVTFYEILGVSYRDTHTSKTKSNNAATVKDKTLERLLDIVGPHFRQLAAGSEATGDQRTVTYMVMGNLLMNEDSLTVYDDIFLPMLKYKPQTKLRRLCGWD